MTLDITKPLQFDDCDNSGTAYQIHDGQRQIAVVEVHEDIDGTPEHDYGRAETHGTAYARLFAGAPDLLQVCQAALLREDIADGPLGDQLRAAIEKAGAA